MEDKRRVIAVDNNDGNVTYHVMQDKHVANELYRELLETTDKDNIVGYEYNDWIVEVLVPDQYTVLQDGYDVWGIYDRATHKFARLGAYETAKNVANFMNTKSEASAAPSAGLSWGELYKK